MKINALGKKSHVAANCLCVNKAGMYVVSNEVVWLMSKN